MSDFGQAALQQLKEIQSKTGWSRTELARKLGVSRTNLTNWLRDGKEPKAAGRFRINKLYSDVIRDPFKNLPPEAPNVLDPLAKKYCEEDEKTVAEVTADHVFKIDDLEPTAIERLNPPDLSEINQKPIEDGYSHFLENLRFFMKESRWNTDEKLETYLSLVPGYISEFGNHTDRFEELKVIDRMCDLLGIPWSVLAFSNVAKEDTYARTRFKLQKMEEEIEALRVKAYTLGSELGYISKSNDEIPKS